MLQPDLFAANPPRRGPQSRADRPLDTAGILDRLTETCERPHYSFMLLTLIAEASAANGSAGPYVRTGDRDVAIRDWLCDAMNPIGRREPRRLALAAKVRAELKTAGSLPDDDAVGDQVIEAEMRRRLRLSGRTNVSRGVSELVRAGLLLRHCQGDYVDHHNRGGKRQAVYTITAETRRALALQAPDGDRPAMETLPARLRGVRIAKPCTV